MIRIKNAAKRIEDTVLVLLSSYNGERYIARQLDSILQQTVPVFILIRDDGSSDGTVAVVGKYLAQYDNIKLVQGKNVGFAKSFSELVANELADQYEYLAFADQDDVWMPDKLECAVSMLKPDYDPEIPAMYCSNLLKVDDHLHELGNVYYRVPKITKYTSLMDNIATGCTIVFNHAAMELYRYSVSSAVKYHDWQMYLICVYLGKVVFDLEPHINYRIHVNNTVGFKRIKRFSNGLSDIFKDFLTLRKPDEKVPFIQNFLTKFKENLSEQDIRILKIYAEYEHSLWYRLIILFSTGFIFRDCILTDRPLGGLKSTLSFKVRAFLKCMGGREY